MKFFHKFQAKTSHPIHLSHYDPSSTEGYEKEKALALIEKNLDRLQKLQSLLYAEGRRSLLIVLQGMDSAGKDGVIRHVMSGLNPQGCSVTSFKEPSREELEHDFLWRIHKWTPAKGTIAIFNRSHYEDVLVARVKKLVPKEVWKARYDQINDFENILSQNGVTILKFFLHISKEEQRKRLEERLKNPDKNWKFSPSDIKERKYWKDYQNAYEHVLERCSTDEAPWFIIPSNKKWFRNFAISEIIREAMEKLNLKFPAPVQGLSKIKVI